MSVCIYYSGLYCPYTFSISIGNRIKKIIGVILNLSYERYALLCIYNGYDNIPRINDIIIKSGCISVEVNLLSFYIVGFISK